MITLCVWRLAIRIIAGYFKDIEYTRFYHEINFEFVSLNIIVWDLLSLDQGESFEVVCISLIAPPYFAESFLL